MTNNITTITPKATAVFPLSSNATRRLAEMRTAVEHTGGGKFEFRTRELAPTPAERLALVQRDAEIVRSLRFATKAEATVEASGLLVMMGAEKLEDDEREAYLRAYIDNLDEIPAFALKEAAKRFVRGEVSAGKFMPRVGELRQEALRLAQPLRGELATIRLILDAKVPESRPTGPRRVPVIPQLKSMEDA